VPREKLLRRSSPLLLHANMQYVPIRKLYWDAFELVLGQAVETLAKDIAVTIGKPCVPLLQAIRDRKVNAYFYEEQETLSVDVSEMRCKHLVPSSETPTLLVSCSNPVLWSSTPGTSMNVCVEHTHANLSGQNLPEWRYIQHNDETFLLDGNYIYTKELVLVGRYCETKQRSTKFIVED
jgi:hypothetical protein